MNKNIERIFQIASKKERKIIGLMSGTSMDGLDVALCLCNDSGSKTTVKLLNFITLPYQDEFRADVKSIFSRRDADLEKVCLLNEIIGTKHAEMILQSLKLWNVPVNEI
ncbi:MAG: anhydro-N-acetylmuramic acid kinase, partial [Sphingobacteriaceae bacterium]|nr:anhydro-N-acetylmuramic acid kinase [Sphingobacteriaceae bacterium]